MRFHDRTQAGRMLAEPLRDLQRAGEIRDPLVLALPRGGVPVGEEVARALHAPLDVLVARKIGAPFNPEFGIGAVAGEGPPLLDEQSLRMLGLTAGDLAGQVERERAELRRREDLYRGGRPAPRLRGRTVIVVDDGLATGVTARAALHAARVLEPESLVLAVPVSSVQAAAAMEAVADRLVCLETPPSFQGVGQWYEDFHQVGDEEVIAALRASAAAR
ncbi:phosphoribosyltransferase [Streptomyces radiopugnans]|uniref:Predicted phosphoribosyltransferase n=1 Tax=Streptomyces radiopugnans TaxID=403935 RepID=A0A1H9BE53_9ACTN|nr:phosphoribosyltransferase family protein [Streptomyces radiopugnans]SEP87165.1 Predicted phosphoribosyltransferase [Streptomyces radiopugnans]